MSVHTSVIIFPHQLFAPAVHPAILAAPKSRVYLVEPPLFFGDHRYPARFHKQKLAFHRATMLHYADGLRGAGHDVEHLVYNSDQRLAAMLEATIDQRFANNIWHIAAVTDYILEKRITAAAKKLGAEIIWHETPVFLNTQADNQVWLDQIGEKQPRMQSFYRYQRRRLNILMNNDGKPVGGKWSYDADNRKKVPQTMLDKIPPDTWQNATDHWQSAVDWVEEQFPNNPGNVTRETMIYPVTHQGAEEALDNFLADRFALFGDYEDAIVPERRQLWHSQLSPLLNCGLLTPHQVIEKVLRHIDTHDILLNSAEGFIRQVIGWREYMRLMYEQFGTKMRTSNLWNHTKPMPKAFYDGATGINPIDDAITTTLDAAYVHHIERLMVLGNMMFLLRIHPDAVYQWFMEMYIDAYDWVMVPNVYAMSQYAVSDLLTTKPYISGSNYICKMSHYKKSKTGDDWAEIWDALYWQFWIDHEDELTSNSRMALLAGNVRKITSEKRKYYKKITSEFLERLQV